ncbi:MAG TPA: hypothetical protein VGW75_12160 [Solirubrobacteraceae bacterium]|nr:hypothetical protein [Solirubrobacteraceae bacterium]
MAFAGDATRFAAWVPGGVSDAAADGDPRRSLAATFVDTRGAAPAAVGAALAAARPDVVVALGVAEHDGQVLNECRAPVLGVVVPPDRPPAWVLRAAAPGQPPDAAALAAAAAHERARLWAPGSPGEACDRLVALDPIDAVGARLWRTIAPPVDDGLFAPVASARRPPRIVFAGPSTEHRERWLAPATHLHDVRHVAHGVTPDRLKRLLEDVDVALVAHASGRATFDHRVALHLAAGHLVLTEPLRPRHGLEPGIDLVEVADPDALARLLGAIRASPDLLRRARVRGRLKAERFKASHVWGRVLTDFLRDVRAQRTRPLV